jgi:uncharacterized membrane protein YeaQ/YmgE (transglycosylase-associated protein family)
MGIITWIVLGLIAGVLANFLASGGFGLIGSIVLGSSGAVIGGFIASASSTRATSPASTCTASWSPCSARRRHRHRRLVTQSRTKV